MNIRDKVAEELKATLSKELAQKFSATLEDFEKASIEIDLGRLPVSFQIRGECSKCGKKCWSTDFFDWAGLGRMLKEFRPKNHCCVE